MSVGQWLVVVVSAFALFAFAFVAGLIWLLAAMDER